MSVYFNTFLKTPRFYPRLEKKTQGVSPPPDGAGLYAYTAQGLNHQAGIRFHP